MPHRLIRPQTSPSAASTSLRVHAPGAARERLPRGRSQRVRHLAGQGRGCPQFGQKSPSDGKKPSKKDEHEEEPKFRSVGDELQTDETFDHDIIDRMGTRFYDEVFVPAIAAAREEGKEYETIRDTIRRGWKPTRAARQQAPHPALAPLRKNG